MNTDRNGYPISIDDIVQVSANHRYEGPKAGMGTVVAFAHPDSAIHGHAFVRFDQAGVTRAVPCHKLTWVETIP